jgi:two-component system sensor histidine kinase HupT/HoxJ
MALDLFAAHDHADAGVAAGLDDERERMWLDVIAKMDEVYSDLIRYEADLEAKNAELEEAQAFISGVIAAVSDILVVVDAAGVVVQVNPAFVRLIGRMEADLVGSPLVDLVAPDDRERMAAILAPAAPVREGEIRFGAGDGASDLIGLAASVRLDAAGRTLGAVVTGRPVGELRRAYEALHRAHQDLRQAQRKLIEQEKMAGVGRLVAGVAHELNNPISFVYGNIHTLDRYQRRIAAYLAAVHDGTADADLRRTLKIDAAMADLPDLIAGTLEGAERVSDIVRNLKNLSFARPGTESPVDIARVATAAVAWAGRGRGEPPPLTIEAEDAVVVDGQEGQLQQVVVNLVQNAMDAVRGRHDAEIHLRVGRDGDHALLSVCDNGPGIPPEAMDKVFEPFFTTKPIGQGTGLGLWIAWSIAREHGGELTALDTGRGACFVLRLPLSRTPPG